MILKLASLFYLDNPTMLRQGTTSLIWYISIIILLSGCTLGGQDKPSEETRVLNMLIFSDIPGRDTTPHWLCDTFTTNPIAKLYLYPDIRGTGRTSYATRSGMREDFYQTRKQTLEYEENTSLINLLNYEGAFRYDNDVLPCEDNPCKTTSTFTYNKKHEMKMIHDRDYTNDTYDLLLFQNIPLVRVTHDNEDYSSHDPQGLFHYNEDTDKLYVFKYGEHHILGDGILRPHQRLGGYNTVHECRKQGF